MTASPLPTRLLGRVRDERQLARAHQRYPQLPLVQCAGARDTARQNLRALRHEREQQLGVLVVDVVDLVRAELAHLAAAEHRAALAVLALRTGARAAALLGAESLASVHRSIPPRSLPMSKRSSRSSSASPRWPSPGRRSAGRPRATRRRCDVFVRAALVRAMTASVSSTRTTRCRMIRSVTLMRRSISFISSPVPLITSST